MLLECFQRPKSSKIKHQQVFELNLEGFYICFVDMLSLIFIVDGRLPAPALHDLQSARDPGRIGRPSASCELGPPEAPPVAPADTPPQTPPIGPPDLAPGGAATPSDPAPPYATPSSDPKRATAPPQNAAPPRNPAPPVTLLSDAFPVLQLNLSLRPVQVVVAILLFGDGVIELPVVAEAFQVEIC